LHPLLNASATGRPGFPSRPEGVSVEDDKITGFKVTVLKPPV